MMNMNDFDKYKANMDAWLEKKCSNSKEQERMQKYVFLSEYVKSKRVEIIHCILNEKSGIEHHHMDAKNIVEELKNQMSAYGLSNDELKKIVSKVLKVPTFNALIVYSYIINALLIFSLLLVFGTKGAGCSLFGALIFSLFTTLLFISLVSVLRLKLKFYYRIRIWLWKMMS